MALDFQEGNQRDELNWVLDELRTKLRALTPEARTVTNTAKRLPGAEAGLESRELYALARGLERVWHIMRLLHYLAEYFGSRLFFGGGSILNYIYMVKASEPPRLTFDLDSAWSSRINSKRTILAEMVKFNRWLSENGLTLKIPVSRERGVELYVVEYDKEKDFFPELLSLRMPVITRYDGEPFHRFLGMNDYSLIMKLRAIFEETLGVKDPRVDYVRFEISLNPGGMPREETVLKDLFGWRTKAWITSIDYQLASKIKYKLGKDFGDDLEYNLHDILKAILDLRLLRQADPSRIMEYVKLINSETVERNLAALLTPNGRRLWERNYHYILVRRKYDLKELVNHVKDLILRMETNNRMGEKGSK